MLILKQVTRFTMLVAAATAVWTLSANLAAADHHEDAKADVAVPASKITPALPFIEADADAARREAIRQRLEQGPPRVADHRGHGHKDGKRGHRHAHKWNPDSMFDRADADGDGNVSREEFHSALKKRMDRAKEWKAGMAKRIEAAKAKKVVPATPLVPAKKVAGCPKSGCKKAACKKAACKKAALKRAIDAKKRHHAHRGHHASRGHGHHRGHGHSAARRSRPSISPGSIGNINAKVVNIHYHFNSPRRASFGARGPYGVKAKAKCAKAKKCGKSKCGKKACGKAKCGKKKACGKSKCGKGKCSKGGKKDCPFCKRGKRASLETDAAAGIATATADEEGFELVKAEDLDEDLLEVEADTTEEETDTADIDGEVDEVATAALYGVDVAELILDEIVNQ